MGLRFIIGRAGTGKTEYCLKEIGTKQTHARHHLIYIVPEQFSLEAEKKLLEKTQGGGILQAQVLSFQRLAFPIFSEKGGGDKALLSDIGKSMILRKIMIEQGKNLEYYKKAADKQGFLEQLGATISEMFQYHISGEKLETFAAGQEEDSVMKAKIHDLRLIYNEYLNFISKDYFSSDETLDVLAEKMEGSSFLFGAEVWLDGFYGFTPQELKIISRLLSNTTQVNVTLTMDRKSFENPNLSMVSPFFEAAETVKKLMSIAQENQVRLEEPIFLAKPLRYQTKEMKALEEQYFYYHPIECKQSEHVCIFAAANRYAEVTETAEEILTLIRDKGLRYRDIALMTRDLKGYEKEIKGVLREYKIPYFIDSKREIFAHPLIELVRSAVEILAYDFNYESVFRYLRTNLTGMDRNKVDILENYVLAFGISSYKWKMEEWNYGFKKHPDEEKKAEINTLKEIFLTPFRQCFPELSTNKKRTVRDWSQRLYELIEMLEVKKRLSEWIQILTDQGEIEKAKEHRQTWGILMDILQKMTEILGEEKITIEEYGKILGAGIENSDMGMLPPGADQILIGDLERSRLPEIKALFILGVNDGILPAPAQEQGIFTEIERSELEKMGMELAHSSKRKAFEEQYLIYCAISKPSHFIWISYSLGDLNGKAMRPSILITKMKKIFPNVIEKREEDRKGLDHISKAGPTLHKLGQQIRRYAEEGTIEEIWKDTISYYKTEEEWKTRFSFVQKGLSDKNEEKYLSPASVQKLYGKDLRTSVSRLEKFISCPYSYFVQYGLKAKERKLYQVNKPDLGTLFHGILELFSKNLEQEKLFWRNLTKKETEERIEKAVDLIVPEIGSEILLSTSSYQYLIRRLKRISKRAVWTLTEHIKKGSFEPLGFEIGFGEKEKLPPIVIDLSNGEKMILDGKIDRVDVWSNEGKKYVKIIDYKSGNKDFNLQDIYYGMQLQLMIYLDAFLKNGESLAEGPLFPGGVFYFRIQDPMISSAETLSQEEIEALLRKELKMSGLVISEEKVLEAMDIEFSEGKTVSDIIPVGYTAKGALKKDSSVADQEAYEAVMEYTKEKAKEIGEEIRSGNVEINPYKKKQVTSCSYCEFKPICRFDTANAENKYRNFKPWKKEEIWEKITEGRKKEEKINLK